jgi:predicted acetyltransferase
MTATLEAVQPVLMVRDVQWHEAKDFSPRDLWVHEPIATHPLDRHRQPVAKLLDPSEDGRQAFLRMARDWRDHGQDRYRLALEDFDAYLARVERCRDPAQVPAGWVPGTEFWLDDCSGEIVACVRLRFRLTPSLEVEGGHIGFDVRPSSRGCGFGSAALRLVLPEAHRRGLARVRLTVDSDNVPSLKIVERNGGVLFGEAISERTGKPIKQYWIDTSPLLLPKNS